jgi:hypothetical protein
VLCSLLRTGECIFHLYGVVIVISERWWGYWVGLVYRVVAGSPGRGGPVVVSGGVTHGFLLSLACLRSVRVWAQYVYTFSFGFVCLRVS